MPTENIQFLERNYISGVQLFLKMHPVYHIIPYHTSRHKL